ncbi:MAG: hypothetical protein L3J29_02275 [Cyclobacteriaceae bacterium]|nr:hypothetical protein [Cyclobacteriaceae bacterium]
MIKLARFLNTLNIDTAFGAVSFVFIGSSIRNVETDPTIYLALAISVLSIYNLDHLFDAYRLKASHSSFRHSFYQRHFKILVIWQLILLIAGIWIIIYLPLQIVLFGTIMCCFIGLYFFIIFKFHHKNYFLREVIVAVGYAFSVAIIPFLASEEILDMEYYGLLLVIFFVALTNLWVFALYDYELDKSQNHHSIARLVQEKRLIPMAKIMIVITMIIIIFYFGSEHYWILGGAFFIIELVYLVMLVNQRFFRKNDYYRLVGELVLVLPGFLLLATNAV